MCVLSLCAHMEYCNNLCFYTVCFTAEDQACHFSSPCFLSTLCVVSFSPCLLSYIFALSPFFSLLVYHCVSLMCVRSVYISHGMTTIWPPPIHIWKWEQEKKKMESFPPKSTRHQQKQEVKNCWDKLNQKVLSVMTRDTKILGVNTI